MTHYALRYSKNWASCWIWKIWCWTHIRASIYRSCILFHKALVLDGSLHYVQCAHYAGMLRIFQLLAWFDTVEFSRLPCSNEEKYDHVVIIERWLYQLTRFWDQLLIVLSPLIHAYIAYKIDSAKIVSVFSRISFWLYDLILSNSIAWRVQTTRCTMMQFSLIDSDMNWLCLEGVYW